MTTLLPAVDIPEGARGVWAVSRFTVSEADARWSAIRDRGRGVRPGTYMRLTRNGAVIMSDTPAEMADHYGFVLRAEGDVLVTGLGLGMVTNALCLKPEVRSVYVVEQSPDVIALVAPTLQDRHGSKLLVVEHDAYKARTDCTFDYAWHDVWDDLCGDNLPKFAAMRRNWRSRMRAPKRQFCWGEELTRHYVRRDKRSAWR